MTNIVLLLSTFSDANSARTAAHTLVEERLVACGNIASGFESIYRWKGNVETGKEILVIFKTTAERSDAAIQRLAELHPFEVPEVVRIPATGGWPAYLDWVKESVRG